MIGKDQNLIVLAIFSCSSVLTASAPYSSENMYTEPWLREIKATREQRNPPPEALL